MHLLIKICDDLSDQDKSFLHSYYSNYRRKYDTDSGLDLVIPNDVVIKPHQSQASQIHLGICCSPVTNRPHGYYLYPRSSLSRTPLRLANSIGLIDYTYTGELIACVDNISNDNYHIRVHRENGEYDTIKLFQLSAPDLTPFTFEIVDHLPETARGSGAFGSTN